MNALVTSHIKTQAVNVQRMRAAGQWQADSKDFQRVTLYELRSEERVQPTPKFPKHRA